MTLAEAVAEIAFICDGLHTRAVTARRGELRDELLDVADTLDLAATRLSTCIRALRGSRPRLKVIRGGKA